MDSSGSHSNNDAHDERNDTNETPENKTKTDVNIEDSRNRYRERHDDDIEEEDFEEENQSNEHCSSDLSSGHCSLNSSSESISMLSNMIENNFTIPVFSKSDDYQRCNTSLKNREIKSPVSHSESKAPTKDDFIQKLFIKSVPEKKGLLKDKLYEENLINSEDSLMAKDCDMLDDGSFSRQTGLNAFAATSSSINDDKKFSVPSTSNADQQLLALDSDGSRLPYTPNLKTSQFYQEDGVKGEPSCSYQSSHEGKVEVGDHGSDKGLWRKRRYEAQQEHLAKRLCNESGVASVPIKVCWPNPGTQSFDTSMSPGLSQFNESLKRFETWPHTEKTKAIEAMIYRCGVKELRYMLDTIEPLLQRDFISLLPRELALNVLCYLEAKDLIRAAQTCHYWRSLVEDNVLWKEQCRRIGITTLKLNRWYMPKGQNPWKEVYMKQCLIDNNWMHMPVDNPYIMRGHDGHVITCLQCYEDRILSGSDDMTLKLWSTLTGKCLFTYFGHTGGVWCSQMMGDIIISGGTDRTLRVWSADTGECLKVLSGHISTVRCVQLYDNRAVSGSRDETLRLWSIPDGQCLQVFKGHTAAVRCVLFDGKVVISAAYDYLVKVWDADSGNCLHTLAGHTNRVYSLKFDGFHIVSSSLDESVRIWDFKTGKLKHTLIDQSFTSAMDLRMNKLVTGNADSVVKIWDITTGLCLHTLSGPNKHTLAITGVQCSNRFIITSSEDGMVKLWDRHTGEFIRNLLELNCREYGGSVWRMMTTQTKLVCAIGSRYRAEATRLLLLDFSLFGEW